MHNIEVIDCKYLRPQFAASFLIQEGERAVFVENNTAHSVPLLLGRLRVRKLSPNQVDFIIVTHVHLDHAGGSHALMEACPNAILLAHPRAAKHLIDPTRLVESAKRVYGVEHFRELYGEIGAIPKERVREMADGEGIGWWASRAFCFKKNTKRPKTAKIARIAIVMLFSSGPNS